LYWEEVALGYDAWSIAQTGRDYHNNFMPLVAFESFGDYKPSGYYYVLSAFMLIFGRSDFVVRLPSVLAGVVIVIATGKLVAWFLGDKKDDGQVKIWTLVSMAVATVTPSLWHLSRVAFETNLATAFLLSGLVLLLGFCGSVSKKVLKLNWRFVVSVVLLILSLYTYHATRVVAPLLGLFVFVGIVAAQRHHLTIFLKSNLTILVSTGVIAIVLTLPILMSLGSPELTDRFAGTNIFSDPSHVLASNECFEIAGSGAGRFVCHRFFFYGREILTNYVSHFSISYLFLSGDYNPRHSTGMFGVYYLFDLVFILLGIFWFFKTFSPSSQKAEERHNNLFKIFFVLFWLIVGIVPASISFASPHLLRTLNIVPLGIVFIVLGIRYLLSLSHESLFNLSLRVQRGKKKSFYFMPLLSLIVVGIYAVQIIFFAFHYFNYYPIRYSSEWQYGYRQMVGAVVDLQVEHPNLRVYIDREHGRPSMYYFWYGDIDPREVQTVSDLETFDQGEYITFKNISFIAPHPDDEQIVALSPSRWQVMQEDENSNYILIDEQVVTNLLNEPVWHVGVLQRHVIAD
jgi:hypothetical protein